MSITLSKFRAAGFSNAPKAIHITAAGLMTDAPQPGAQVIDCKGAYLSPGWCDLHDHVWHGGTYISVLASEACRPEE
jgi:dihydroorotase